jgi:aspartate/methionine/tyrosine aminotransferase
MTETTSNIHFSHRVEVGQTNPIIALQRQFKAQGVALRQLNDSNPTHHGLTLASLPQRYNADPRGQYPARQALAQFLTDRHLHGGFDVTLPASSSDSSAAQPAQSAQLQSAPVDPSNVYLASSTSEAYSWLMKLLCDPGEAVLCSTPGYPLISSIARLEGIHAVEYPLHYDGSWVIDVPEIKRLLEASLSSDKAERQTAQEDAFDRVDNPQAHQAVPPIRAIILISPNNPTASYVLRSDYEQIIQLCQQYHLPLIVDEVFFDFQLRPLEKPFRISGEDRVLTFGLDGFSKLLAAPHAKVGWIEVSGPQQDREAALPRLDMISDDFLPMSGIIAEQIPELLQRVPSQVARISQRTRANLETLDRLISSDPKHLVTLLRPEGGWNVLLRFPGSLDESQLVDTLMRTRHLTAQPGYFFDMPTNGYVCVSLLPEPEEFTRNVTDLLETIDSFFQ